MKKEIVAVCILVLIFAASLVNIRFINMGAERLVHQIKQTAELSESGEYEKALEVFRPTMEEWWRLDGYVHIMLRHDEIDPISDEFYVVLEELEKGETTGASFGNLIENLEKLAEMEQLSWSAIF